MFSEVWQRLRWQFSLFTAFLPVGDAALSLHMQIFMDRNDPNGIDERSLRFSCPRKDGGTPFALCPLPLPYACSGQYTSVLQSAGSGWSAGSVMYDSHGAPPMR
jgi:hypothetical protein